MIKKQFNVANNNTPTYYTDRTQYLKARNLTFDQNQYHFVRLGNSREKPGSSLTINNLYTANGLTHCTKYTLGSSVTFQYIWVDDKTYTVTVSPGIYTVDDINTILFTTFFRNGHVLIDKNSNMPIYFLEFGYNNVSNKVELQIYPIDTSIYSSTFYKIPNALNVEIPKWTFPTLTKNAMFVIQDNLFASMIGFEPGKYPSTSANGSNQALFNSTLPPLIGEKYQPMYFKPNNWQFGQQGAVTASSLITRIKYNTITTNAGLYTHSIGPSVGSAMAYSSVENPYTIKDKIGFPLTKTPVIDKYTGNLKCVIPNTRTACNVSAN